MGALAFVHGPILTGVIMAIRGIAITAYVAAEFAYASAVVAPERAVSATATLGMVGNLSFATAPAAGFRLWQHGIERQQFRAASTARLRLLHFTSVESRTARCCSPRWRRRRSH